MTEITENNDVVTDLGDNTLFKITTFNQQTRIDIRRYYIDSTTQENKPSLQGISLNEDTFLQIADAINQGLTELTILNGTNITKFTTTTFRQEIRRDIRHYYIKNGQTLPTKKGISLTPTQFTKLQEIIANV